MFWWAGPGHEDRCLRSNMCKATWHTHCDANVKYTQALQIPPQPHANSILTGKCSNVPKEKKKTSHSTCCEHRWMLRKSKLYIGLLACVYCVPSVDWSQDLTFSTCFLNRGFCVLSAYQWNKLISKSAALALMAACCLQSHWKLKLCSRVKKSNSRESKQIAKKKRRKYDSYNWSCWSVE